MYMYFPLRGFHPDQLEQHKAIGAVCGVVLFLPVLITVAGSLCVCLCMCPLTVHAQSYPWHNLGHGASPLSGYRIQQILTHAHIPLGCSQWTWGIQGTAISKGSDGCMHILQGLGK